MGRVMVRASAIGANGTRVFTFLVDTGSTFVGLPVEDIEALGLPILPGEPRRIQTATGIIEQHAYGSSIRLNGETTYALVTETPVPLIGYEVLENLKLKVNPVTEELEKAGEDEHMPPYFPYAFLVADEPDVEEGAS